MQNRVETAVAEADAESLGSASRCSQDVTFIFLSGNFRMRPEIHATSNSTFVQNPLEGQEALMLDFPIHFVAIALLLDYDFATLAFSRSRATQVHPFPVPSR